MKIPHWFLPAVFCALGSVTAWSAPRSSNPGAAALKPTSEFSSTNRAKSKMLVGGEGRATFLCSGFGGYQVEYEVFAVRSAINLRYGGKTVYLLDQTFENCPGENPEKANDVVQWRGYRKGNSFNPYAVIYRLTSQNPQQPKSRYNTLMVIKLDGENSRVVGHVSGSRSDGNTAAEALADQLCAPGSAGGGAQTGDKNSGEPVVEAGGAGRGGIPQVHRGEDGTDLEFPNGQKFRLESTRGVLGPSSDPSSQVPFVGPGGWLVAVNEAPATKTSHVHLYLRDKAGRFSEIKGAHAKIFKMVSVPGYPKNPDFVRVESLSDAWDGKLRVNLQVQDERTGELQENAVVVGRTGAVESGFRGE
jgi:hypothetical protein